MVVSEVELQEKCFDFLEERKLYHYFKGVIAPLCENKKVLDLGAGRGAYSEYLVDYYGCDVLAVEFSDAFLEEMRGRGIATFKQDLNIYPYVIPGKYDIIVLVSVLEHLYSPYLCLLEALKLLRPGGKIFIQVPEVLKYWNGPEQQVAPQHHSYFNRETLTPLLLHAGFLDVEYSQVGYLSSNRFVLKLCDFLMPDFMRGGFGIAPEMWMSAGK